MENILEVQNLTKQYSGFSLQNLSFSLPRGYIMGFIGPNGAGKTTTIKLIMNLLRKDGGHIKVLGQDNVTDELAIKERIGFVYDDSNFYEEMTVREIGSLVAPFYKRWDDGQFKSYISKFDLPFNKKVKTLSRGMKTKLSLAVALSHGAELIIMDEPTSGLDPIFRNDILDILFELIQDEEKGVLFSTHITNDLDKVADYITFINNGQLVFSTSREEIIDKYAVVKGGKELLDADVRRELLGVKENRFGFDALTNDANKVRKLLGESVVIEKANLEDIMLLTVRGGANV